jgi:NAD+ synthase (glutamine-hydrolysing)
MKESLKPTTLTLHQTHQTLADLDSIYTTLTTSLKESSLHVFPEMYLTGYPLKDVILQKSFILAYENLIERINDWSLKVDNSVEWTALIGGIKYELDHDHKIKKIENVVYELKPKQKLTPIYSKRLLPNYDIFDEQKYFTAGEHNCFYQYNDSIFGILICEDMWASNFHKMDPCEIMFQETIKKDLTLSGIINLSASPFNFSKKISRHKRASTISHFFKCPFFYVNLVAGEDEVLFDGQSFCLYGDKIICELKAFQSDQKSISLNEIKTNFNLDVQLNHTNTWEQLFTPRLQYSNSTIRLQSLSDEECQEILNALIFGLQEYAQKSKFKKFLIALSGGIDSALVLAITHLALRSEQELEAIYMPSAHSSQLSTQLCEKMCKKLNLKLQYLPIKFLHSAIKNTFENTFTENFSGLTDENVQSRLRGMLLYTRSNQTGAMVINTSNKSELAVGYSTQYGDSVGAISLLGDLYKTEVYALSNYINKKFNQLIPEEIISRGPSAELRENQLDQDSLPAYEILDPILEGILSYGLCKTDLIQNGFDTKDVEKVLQLYSRSEYKRAQFCPIIKLKSKSFGFGYRISINKNNQYLNF